MLDSLIPHELGLTACAVNPLTNVNKLAVAACQAGHVLASAYMPEQLQPQDRLTH